MNCFYCCTSIVESVEKPVEKGIVTLVGEDLSGIIHNIIITNIEPGLETTINTEVNEALIIRENLAKPLVNEIQTNIPFVNEDTSPLKINIQIIK